MKLHSSAYSTLCDRIRWWLALPMRSHDLFSNTKLYSILITIKTQSTNSWWRHQMETFSALLTICAGNSPVPGEFPAQRPVMRSFDVLFDLRLNKPLSKREAGDLSCHRAHYDVIVMSTFVIEIRWLLASPMRSHDLFSSTKLYSILITIKTPSTNLQHKALV